MTDGGWGLGYHLMQVTGNRVISHFHSSTLQRKFFQPTLNQSTIYYC